MIPTDPQFYLSFFTVLIITVLLALIGGKNGITLGKLIHRNVWLAGSAIRLLRIGMWLPIFLLWCYPPSFLHNRAVFQILPLVRPSIGGSRLVSIVAGSLATTTVFFGACYYYLTRRLLPRPHAAHGRLHLHREIFLLALFACLLWQHAYGNGWPYRWIWGVVIGGEAKRVNIPILYITLTTWLSMFLVMIVVALTNRLCRWSLDGAAESRRSLLSVELHNSNRRSLVGASLSLVLALLFWQLLNQPLETYFLIPPPAEIVYAIVQLLTSEDSTFWLDAGASLFVLLGGVLWAAVFAIPLVGFCHRRQKLKRCAESLALSCISPILLQHGAILWFGVGRLRIAFVISCFAFFPLLQALWSYRQLSVAHRLLISIDETLPYAFLGMLVGEAYASTRGVGFLIIVASSRQETAKAFAALLILFAFLAAISGVLRWMTKGAAVRSATVVPAAAGG